MEGIHTSLARLIATIYSPQSFIASTSVFHLPLSSTLAVQWFTRAINLLRSLLFSDSIPGTQSASISPTARSIHLCFRNLCFWSLCKIVPESAARESREINITLNHSKETSIYFDQIWVETLISKLRSNKTLMNGVGSMQAIECYYKFH